MAQEVPPPPRSVFLCSFMLVSYLLGDETRLMHLVGRSNLTPVARPCDSSCETGDVVPIAAHTQRFVVFLCHGRGLLPYPHPYLSDLVAITSHLGTLFPLQKIYSVAFVFLTEP